MTTGYIDLPVVAENPLTTGNLTDAGTDGIVITGGTNAVVGTGTSIAQHVADATHNGYLSSTNFTIFNNKQPAISGASGSFTTVDLKTVTVVNGIITAIVP